MNDRQKIVKRYLKTPKFAKIPRCMIKSFRGEGWWMGRGVAVKGA